MLILPSEYTVSEVSLAGGTVRRVFVNGNTVKPAPTRVRGGRPYRPGERPTSRRCDSGGPANGSRWSNGRAGELRGPTGNE